MSQYNDILHKERPVSNRPKMDLGNRAKIFAPFSALSGIPDNADYPQKKLS